MLTPVKDKYLVAIGARWRPYVLHVWPLFFVLLRATFQLNKTLGLSMSQVITVR